MYMTKRWKARLATIAHQQAECKAWNDKNPPGSAVLYWRGYRGGAPSGSGHTTSFAAIDNFVTVVWVDGQRFLLHKVEAI